MDFVVFDGRAKGLTRFENIPEVVLDILLKLKEAKAMSKE